MQMTLAEAMVQFLLFPLLSAEWCGRAQCCHADRVSTESVAGKRDSGQLSVRERFDVGNRLH